MNLKKTKIVCTIGPSSENPDTIVKMLEAGMNVARFNFSHGDHTEKKHQIDVVKAAVERSGIPCAYLLDTKGPEIRTGNLKDGKKIILEADKEIIVTTENYDSFEGSPEKIAISYQLLPEDILKAGITEETFIYIADGVLSLKVLSVDGNNIKCRVVTGGELGQKKNVNVVGVKTRLPAMAEKDKADLEMGIKNGIHFVAASFIRKASDVLEMRKHLDAHGGETVKIISKIEDNEGLENIDDIIRVSDGIMVARGDLGVQIKIEDIPLAQKTIIEKCNKAAKPVITATQMLDSMINNPRPTRAEVNDVANAIFDGTDAVMLSGETAQGKYPVEAVETMAKVAIAIERSPEYLQHIKRYFSFHATQNVSDAIAKAGFVVASDIKAKAIIAPTKSGTTAKLISKYRPEQIIVAATTSEIVAKQLLLVSGVYPIITKLVNDSDVMLNNSIKAALDLGFIDNFDKVVLLAGVPINSPMLLNMIKAHVVCNVLNKGGKGFGNLVSGQIVKVKDATEAIARIKTKGNYILLTKILDKEFESVIGKIKGIILEESSEYSFEKLQSLNKEVTLVSDVADAYAVFEDGLIVSVDGNERNIYEGAVKHNQK